MEKLENNTVLKFDPNTLQLVREEVGLTDPNVIKQSIEILEQWLKMQQHFVKKDFSQEFLERCLVMNKGSVERTKNKLDKMCTVKHLMPHFFVTIDAAQDIAPYKVDIIHAIMPFMTKQQERVLIMKNYTYEHNETISSLRYLIKMAEYTRAYDYNNGVILILDYSEADLKVLLPKINPIDIHHFTKLVLDSYALRLKGVHLISNSKLVLILEKLFKIALSDKILKRFLVHKNYKSLLKVIPKEVLPEEYGGTIKKSLNLMNDVLLDALTSEDFKRHLEDQYKAITDETKRPRDTFNDQYLGTPGSFRVISID